MIYLQDRSNSPRCLLSSDTQETAGDNAYQLSPGAVYAEKDCKETSDSSSRLPEISNSNWALASSGGGRDPISLMRDRIYEALPQVIFIHVIFCSSYVFTHLVTNKQSQFMHETDSLFLGRIFFTFFEAFWLGDIDA